MRKSGDNRPDGGVFPPKVGRWVWACREGSEATLRGEFERAGQKSRVLAGGLVESQARPPGVPTFARLGFKVEAVLPWSAEVGKQAASHWKQAVWIQAWVPDSTLGNRLSKQATKVGGDLLAERRRSGLPVHESAKSASAAGVALGQVLVLPGWVVLGTLSAEEGDPWVAGGRTRVRRHGESPSRAAMKLDEALAWKGDAPGRGDVCVDLGAAPGGWSERLLAMGARVIAIDPGRLREDLMRNKALEHVMASAFDYEPAAPVDWLFCDMAWRPLEVAQLLAKWARNGWALHLVANIKLPMRDKLPMVERVRETLVAGGWRALQTRQLYHDRDEITVHARSR